MQQKQKEAAQKSLLILSSLQILKILNYRNQFRDKEQEKLLFNLQKGEEGELEVLRFIDAYGLDDWQTISNYWGDWNGSFESDLILCTSNSCYVLEIKNYTGRFDYINGVSSIDGREIHSDCVFQTRRSFKNIRHLIQRHVPSANIQGVLIFIGAHNEVRIHSEVEDIQIVRRNELKRFIQNIAQEEQQHRSKPINFQKIKQQLKRHQIENPYLPPPVSSEKMQALRKGMVCAVCCSFDIQITRGFVKCACGNVEKRSEATVRTINEYSLLNYKDHLTIKDLSTFFNGQASKRYLNNILSAHFEMIKQGKNTYYINKYLTLARM